jgi:hypothetical protein
VEAASGHFCGAWPTTKANYNDTSECNIRSCVQPASPPSNQLDLREQKIAAAEPDAADLRKHAENAALDLVRKLTAAAEALSAHADSLHP